MAESCQWASDIKNLHSSKKEVILLCQSILETRKISHLHGLALFAIPLNETKLDESFPIAKFTLGGYEIRARRDRTKFGGALIEYVRKVLICKRISKYDPNFNESIYSEITFSKERWVIFRIYRPLNVKNLTHFFWRNDYISNKSDTKFWKQHCYGRL